MSMKGHKGITIVLLFEYFVYILYSNAVDDTIIILMPLITTVTLIVCLLLLHFLTGH